MTARARDQNLSRDQGGVLSAAQLRSLVLPDWFVREQIRVGRWARVGRTAVATHNGPLDAQGRRALAVCDLGPQAALAGVSVLQHLGLTLEGDGFVHVIVPKGAGPHRVIGVRVHESRRFRDEDVDTAGLRCVRAPVAAVQAALWSRTDREAAFILTLAVQGRVATPAQLSEALERVRSDRRRVLLMALIVDLEGGVRSLGELDVARAMRDRGLPEPERQSVRRRPSGTQYLDADFPAYEIVLEVDGWQHDRAEHALADCLRDIDLGAEGRTVVRIPLVGWRVGQGEVLDALERLFRARGWRPGA